MAFATRHLKSRESVELGRFCHFCGRSLSNRFDGRRGLGFANPQHAVRCPRINGPPTPDLTSPLPDKILSCLSTIHLYCCFLIRNVIHKRDKYQLDSDIKSPLHLQSLSTARQWRAAPKIRAAVVGAPNCSARKSSSQCLVAPPWETACPTLPFCFPFLPLNLVFFQLIYFRFHIFLFILCLFWWITRMATC